MAIFKSIKQSNSEGDDVSSSLAYDGQRLLLFKYTDGQSDIYESKLKGMEWSEPKLMSKVVNTDANETFASYDPQDIKVYFITDGGHGGDKNISFSGKKDMEETFWGKAQSRQEVNQVFKKVRYIWHPMAKPCISVHGAYVHRRL